MSFNSTFRHRLWAADREILHSCRIWQFIKVLAAAKLSTIISVKPTLFDLPSEQPHILTHFTNIPSSPSCFLDFPYSFLFLAISIIASLLSHHWQSYTDNDTNRSAEVVLSASFLHKSHLFTAHLVPFISIYDLKLTAYAICGFV